MQDHVVPDEAWKFDGEVTACFDDMLSRSIPDYANMRELCFNIGSMFVGSNAKIVDLGASRGNAIAPYVTNGDNNNCIAIELSTPMRKVLSDRFRNCDSFFLSESNVKDWHDECCDLVLAVLTIQFIPINYRQKIIQNVYKSLNTGGAFIFVEKVLGETAQIDSIFIDAYHKFKNTHGKYSEEQIKRKAMSLEGVLVPVTSSWNVDMLKSSGFKCVDCFWRSMNFAGWVAIK